MAALNCFKKIWSEENFLGWCEYAHYDFLSSITHCVAAKRTRRPRTRTSLIKKIFFKIFEFLQNRHFVSTFFFKKIFLNLKSIILKLRKNFVSLSKCFARSVSFFFVNVMMRTLRSWTEDTTLYLCAVDLKFNNV